MRGRKKKKMGVFDRKSVHLKMGVTRPEERLQTAGVVFLSPGWRQVGENVPLKNVRCLKDWAPLYVDSCRYGKGREGRKERKKRLKDKNASCIFWYLECERK